MPYKLPSEWLDELCSRVNIEDVVGEAVPLRQKGKYLWACCPFHNEKTPSFKVDAESQLFYCFGCHKGGNVIKFVMDNERLEFMEAIESLAERAHMRLPDRLEPTADDDYNHLLREKIYDANLHAAKFYHATLWTGAGAEALKYLYSRGLNDADIRRFGLGASPRASDALKTSLTDAGFSDEVIEKAWLCGQKDGRWYDMFRSRVIFPILDAKGRVLGFGGRVIGDGNPKYLNTSDTPVFNKRNGLYALNFAKKESGLKRLVLVEGYMDVLSLIKHGVAGVVATLGTALTDEQARLIKRFAPEVWISYDGDAAGQKAALRALDILIPRGLNVRVLAYPSQLDPDDFIRKNGLQAFNDLRKLTPIEYRITRARDGLDMATQEGRTQYTMRACEILKAVTSPVELENHLRSLAHDTGYSRDVLIRQIGAVNMPKPMYEQPKAKPPAEIKRTEAQEAQMQLISLIHAGLIPPDVVKADDFDSELYRDIYSYIASGVKPREFIGDLSEEQANEALMALNYEPLPEDRDRAMDICVDLLRTIRISRVNSKINALAILAKTADGEDKKALNRQIQALIAQLD